MKNSLKGAAAVLAMMSGIGVATIVAIIEHVILGDFGILPNIFWIIGMMASAYVLYMIEENIVKDTEARIMKKYGIKDDGIRHLSVEDIE